MEKISTETRRISSRSSSSSSSSSSSTRRRSPHKRMKRNAISWLVHSIKILLGDESIRRYIILKYNPELKYKNHIKTFNAFIKPGKTREHKHKEIKKYLQAISRLKKDNVVFTATNVLQDEEDIETHFQSFIVDNNNKTVYGIDPAYDKNKENFIGIYYAEILHDVIKPFFENKQYQFHLVRLSRPAQTTTDDVFCQSWSLLILLKIMENKDYEKDVEIYIPSRKLDKYHMLLEFYKQIFTDMPELLDNLKAEYEGSISDYPELLEFDVGSLLMSMKKDDM